MINTESDDNQPMEMAQHAAVYPGDAEDGAEICWAISFPPAAAGINHLPADQLDAFIEAFRHQYQG